MEFRDLKKQYQVLKKDIDAQISDVAESAHFISGPQVAELEEKLASYVGVQYCICCANGTDALTLALMAWVLDREMLYLYRTSHSFPPGSALLRRGQHPFSWM